MTIHFYRKVSSMLRHQKFLLFGSSQASGHNILQMPKLNGEKAQQMLTDTIQRASSGTWRAVPRKEPVGVHAASVGVPHKTDAKRNAHLLTFFVREKSSLGSFLKLEMSNTVGLSKKPSVLP